MQSSQGREGAPAAHKVMPTMHCKALEGGIGQQTFGGRCDRSKIRTVYSRPPTRNARRPPPPPRQCPLRGVQRRQKDREAGTIKVRQDPGGLPQGERGPGIYPQYIDKHVCSLVGHIRRADKHCGRKIKGGQQSRAPRPAGTRARGCGTSFRLAPRDRAPGPEGWGTCSDLCMKQHIPFARDKSFDQGGLQQQKKKKKKKSVGHSTRAAPAVGG